MKKLSIEDLAQAANSQINSMVTDDQRQAPEVSERRIRDYMTKGLLNKPYGQGRDKWFGDDHVQQLVGIRQLQSEGYTERQIKKIADSASNTSFATSSSTSLNTASNTVATSNASGMLCNASLSPASIDTKPDLLIGSVAAMYEPRGYGKFGNFGGHNTSNVAAESTPLQTDALNYLSTLSGSVQKVQKQVSKSWSEYQLDSEGQVFLRVASGTKIKNPEEIINQLTKIINQGDTK